MRSLFGIVSVLVVLVVLGLVAKQQLRSVATSSSAASIQAGVPVDVAPNATPAEVTQRVKEQVNAALQSAPRPDADK